MRPTGLLRLYRARLRARTVLVQGLFAILGIAVGVALLFASQVANSSLGNSVGPLTSGIAGHSQLQVMARSSQGFEEELVARVRHLHGVRAAAPILETRADLVGPAESESVDLIGVGPGLARLGGSLLRELSPKELASIQAIALPLPLARSLGVRSLQPITMNVGDARLKALVGATLSPERIGAMASSLVAIAPLSYAQRVSGRSHSVSRIFVEVRQGAEEQVRRELQRLSGDHLNVEPGDYESTLFEKAAFPTEQATNTFSAISALVGFLFAFNAMLLTVPMRRNLILDMRIDGATRSDVVKVLLFDALIIALIACAIGLVVGDLVSLIVFGHKPGYLSFGFPVGTQRLVTFRSAALACGAGLLAAIVGVLAPVRSIFSRPLRVTPPSRRRGPGNLVLGAILSFLLCLAATVVVLAGVPQASLIASVVLIAALLALLPLCLQGVLAAFERLARPLMAAAPRLAMIELRAAGASSRSIAVAATAAIAVFGAVAIQGAHEGLEHGLDRLAGGLTSISDVWVSPTGPQNVLETSSFPSEPDRSRLAHLPGVLAVDPYHAAFLDYGSRRVWVIAPPSGLPSPLPAGQILGSDPGRALARLRAGGWAIVSRALARERHLNVGDTFLLPAPEPMRVRVAGVSTNLGWPSGAIVLDSADYRRGWGGSEASAYNVLLEPAASRHRVIGEIRGALGPDSGLAVESSATRDSRQRAGSDRNLQRSHEISRLVLLAGILAVAAVMSAMVWQRRLQLAALKLDGFRRGVLWRGLLCESALLVGSGSALGALFGMYGQLLMSHALLDLTGFPVRFSVGALAAAENFAVVTLVAGLIIALPGFLAAGVRPAPLTASD